MDGAVSFLLTQGILGIACLALAGVIVVLYKDNNRLHLEKDALQEQRRIDAKDTADKVSLPLDSISQTVKLIYDKLEVSKRR